MKRAWAALIACIALCLAAITFLTARAHADPVSCGDLKPMLDKLVKLYHEFVVMTGDATGSQMIVTRSDSGTFTVLVANGLRACIVLTGEKAEFDNGT